MIGCGEDAVHVSGGAIEYGQQSILTAEHSKTEQFLTFSTLPSFKPQSMFRLQWTTSFVFHF